MTELKRLSGSEEAVLQQEGGQLGRRDGLGAEMGAS